MKAYLTPTPAYTYTPGASGVGTVDLRGINDFDVANLSLIVNHTRGIPIYAAGSDFLSKVAYFIVSAGMAEL